MKNIIRSIQASAKNVPLCITILMVAFVFGIVLPFGWDNDPADTYGTLSILCEHHLPWFWAWALLESTAFILNFEHLFYKYKYDKTLLHITLFIACAGMILTAATLNHSVQTINPKRVLHWIGAICYAAGLLATSTLFFALNMKRRKRFIPFFIFCLLMIGMMLLWVTVIGRNGYMEMVPIALFQCVLFILNFTGLVPAAESTGQTD